MARLAPVMSATALMRHWCCQRRAGFHIRISAVGVVAGSAEFVGSFNDRLGAVSPNASSTSAMSGQR
jgi:hypothetical protein